MIEWIEFYPLVLPSVRGCSDMTVDRHLAMVVRDWCERTARYEVKLEDIVIVNASQRDFQLAAKDIEIIHLLDVWVGDSQVEVLRDIGGRRMRRSKSGQFAWVDEANVLHLSFSPSRDGAILRTVVAARPMMTAAGAPELLRQDMPALANGAMATLMQIPKQAWSDPAAAQVFGAMYERAAQAASVKHSLYRYHASMVGAPGFVAVASGVPMPAAQAPMLSSALTDLVLTAGLAFSFQIPAGTFTDPAGLAMTYTVAALPTWATFNPETRTITGCPPVATSAYFTVVATNSAGMSTNATMLVLVSALQTTAPAAPSPSPAPAPAPAVFSPTPVPALAGVWTYSTGDEFDAWDAARYKIGAWWGDTNDDGKVNYDVSGGSLRIFPKRASSGLLIHRTITTEGRWQSSTASRYYVEVRFKLAPGAGRFPGIWLNNHLQDVPARPELDLMETGTGQWWGDGTNPLRVKATTWTDTGISVNQSQPNGQTSQGVEFLPAGGLVNVWHTCGAMVDPKSKTVTYFIDGTQIGQHTSASTTKPLFLALDEWFDGAFNVGTPANGQALETAAQPIQFDYWRVWTSPFTS